MPAVHPPELEARFRRAIEADRAALWRLTASYAASREDREDLFQDICAAFWTALPRFRGDASERTFLFRIAHNRGISHRSRRIPDIAPEAAVESVAAAGPDPHRRAEESQRRDRLTAAIRQLPMGQRQVVTLRLEGLAYEQIADIVGISESNVGVRLHRARKALETRLEALR